MSNEHYLTEQEEALMLASIRDEHDTFFLDLDGVLWKGGNQIEGSLEAVKFLQDEGKQVFFITNNNSISRDTLCTKLLNLGYSATVDMVYTSNVAMSNFLLDSQYQGKVFAIGASPLFDELKSAGLHVVPSDSLVPPINLSGQDNGSYSELAGTAVRGYLDFYY
eukprot:GHVR01013139.1.p1 GENE.GHVR01013139.1~~GHVR01013139.1.p1  ORF type:complete len:183 (+),score=4.69 GHVR01013139.1:58-549(+)